LRLCLHIHAAQSREANDKLKSKIEVAEQIIRLAEICRKLETEEEKVIPFYAESVTQEELAAAGGSWLQSASTRS
jgi:hypothetical protein